MKTLFDYQTQLDIDIVMKISTMIGKDPKNKNLLSYKMDPLFKMAAAININIMTKSAFQSIA